MRLKWYALITFPNLFYFVLTYWFNTVLLMNALMPKNHCGICVVGLPEV
jgi:hypothetical protein